MFPFHDCESLWLGLRELADALQDQITLISSLEHDHPTLLKAKAKKAPAV